eukprot:365464-Chlamydomonas_euryale.AAC.3
MPGANTQTRRRDPGRRHPPTRKRGPGFYHLACRGPGGRQPPAARQTLQNVHNPALQNVRNPTLQNVRIPKHAQATAPVFSRQGGVQANGVPQRPRACSPAVLRRRRGATGVGKAAADALA